MRKIVLSIVLAVGAALGAVALAGGPDEQNADRGWLVEQEGRPLFYPFQDEWLGEAHPSGFTLTNPKKKVTVYYYGTFRVEHKDKGS